MSVQLSSNPPVGVSPPAPQNAAGNPPAGGRPPPPVRPNNRRGGRDKVVFALFLVILLGVAAMICLILLVPLLARERKPEILINSLSVSSFNLNGSSSQLSANWTMELLVVNVDSRYHIQYESFDVFVFYGRGFDDEFFLAKAKDIPSFDQNPRTGTKLVAEARGQKQNLNSRVAGLMVPEQHKNGSITIGLQLQVHVISSQFHGYMIFTCSDLKVVLFPPPSSVQTGTMIGGPKKFNLRSFSSSL
ncbi:OLC1v1016706C1 [Oldenlandia corymbosa var. corymbosa]|uniref:OLC1v1016706C1 n=1 Tax=Oldenlandia corymbosa var. corymbosa TaxID=529605 RepID=A0AAV1E7S3_OLDCO|nr:OLC1v1016706C1 [Oldenlandia corymbosa var. corymbosa]